MSFTPYMALKLGLVAWVNLGTSGEWGASYEIDLTVDHPDAAFGGTLLDFNFSQYEIVSATISSKGFGGGEKGIGAGLDLVVGAEAGVKDIKIKTFLKDWSLGNFTIIPRIDKTINLIKVTIEPEYSLELTDGLELTARLPQGADTEGYSKDSTVVSGHGVSDTKFISLDADLDQLLTDLLKKMGPPIAAVGSALANTVFFKQSHSMLSGRIKLELSVVDVIASAGLALNEDVKLDIADPKTGIPNINIRLTSDNGTPDDVSDDTTVAVGKLGDVIQILAPSKTASGVATITAKYNIDSASFEHKVGISAVADITLTVLSARVKVLSFLNKSFGPLYKVQFPEKSLELPLGSLFSDKFLVGGSIFNTEYDKYEVFYAQKGVAPAGWDPTAPDAKGSALSYFEANYEQQSAAQLEYGKTGFDSSLPNGLAPDNPIIELRNDSGTKVQFIWIADYDYTVNLNQYNGSLITVVPSAKDPQGNLIVTNLLGKTGNDANYLQFNSAWQEFYSDVQNTAVLDDVSFRYGGKTLYINSKADVVGNEKGDVLVYGAWGGNFFDGKGNTGNEWDVFIANFQDTSPNTPIMWDLAKSITEENDNNPNTVGGITLANGVTVRNVEAAALFTGNADDYLVGGVQSDVFVTGGGNDIVKLPYYVPGANGNGSSLQLDIADDYVRLDGGNDIVLVELGNVPAPQSAVFTDYLFGGSGADFATVRSGLQGVKIDTHYTQNGSYYFYRFGGEGIGADALITDLSDLITIYNNQLLLSSSNYTDTGFYANNHTLLLNGGSAQGRIEISNDIEFVNIYIDAGSDQGAGDDLLMFMGGAMYDGGYAGDDTFLADFTAWENRLDIAGNAIGTNGGLRLIATEVVSYFGKTIIQNIDRLHVKGTTDADLIYGGNFVDHIHGGAGDDFIYGGPDRAADELYGGDGNDTFFWINSGNDFVDGHAGTDTISIRYNASDSYLDNSTYGNTYQFFDANGATMLSGSTQQFTADSLDYKLVDALAFSKVAASQLMGFQDKVKFTNVERVDIVGSNSADDLLIYQGGNYYDGGESLTGLDGDVFIADFSAQSTGIDFRINDVVEAGEEDGYWLGNEVFIKGIDRGVIKAGSSQDRLIGGRFADIFMGGGGADILYGGEDNSPDILEGGEGSDTFYWYTDPTDRSKSGGSDTIKGGTNADGSVEKDNLIMAGGTGPSRVAISLLDSSTGKYIDTLPNNGGSTRGYAWAYSDNAILQVLAENSLNSANRWQYYNSTVGTYEPNRAAQFGILWDPTKQRDGRVLTYEEIESVDLAGSDAFDDIIVYQHGSGYVGGESAGDADIFVANLTEFSNKLFFDASEEAEDSYDIGQGTRISGFERFYLLLGAGNDEVRGGELADVVYAGDGRDLLVGGLGNDRLYGEAGDDFFEHTGGKDVYDGGEGTDALLIGAAADATSITLLGTGDVAIGSRLTMLGAALTLADFGALFGAKTESSIRVDHGSNSLQFSSIEHVQMSGSEGNDVLLSGIEGGVLFAGSGDDALIGRGGNDFMSGGAGSDIYVLGPNFGNDEIFGESSSANTLIFTAYAAAELNFTPSGSDLLVSAGVNTVRIRDYFANNAEIGLDFNFQTSDATFKKNFTGLGAQSATMGLAGSEFIGDNTDEQFIALTANTDTVRAFGGDDFINSSPGADIIDGGAGTDSVSYYESNAAININLITYTGSGGHAQGDLLFSIENIAGSVFDDIITGSNSINLIIGDLGNDTIYGMDGDDVLSGWEGNDLIDGGDGSDQLYGDEGNDTLYGQAGIDLLLGGEGNDLLDGGDQDDILDSGPGDDRVFGGAGNDFLIYTSGFDQWDGGAGMDTGDFSTFSAAVKIDLASATMATTRDTDDVNLSDGTERNVLQLANIENIRGSILSDAITGNSEANQLEGNLGDDILTGNGGADILNGGGGTDTIDYSKESGGAGISVLMSDSGNQYATDTYGDRDVLLDVENIIGTQFADNIIGNTANNIIWGGAGNDYILDGDAGDDLIYGGDGDDFIYGGIGNDILVGGAGNDKLHGDAGDDILVGGQDTGNDNFNGGSGFDSVSFANATLAIDVDLTKANGQITSPESGTDTLVSIENIIGGSGNDRMLGDNKANSFSYFGGLDTYDGAGGIDTVSYSQFKSAVLVNLESADEAQTRDRIDLAQGALRVVTQLANIENVIGSNFDDELHGNALTNILAGGDGNDVIYSGLGGDSYLGGNGNDSFIVQSANGSATFDGGDGIDTLDYSKSADWVRVSLVNGDGDDVVTNVERLVGTNFGDTLTGSADPNILQGGTGDDLILAAAGDDLIFYTGGYDYVYGEDGFDTIDFSLFASAVVLDFNEQIAVSTSDSGDWSNGTLRPIVEIFSLDVENAIGGNGNDKFTGSSGANTFNGGLGVNLIQGMAGDDTYVYGGGTDTWDGGAGTDTVNFSSYQFAVNVDISIASPQATSTMGTATPVRITSIANTENLIGSLFGDQLKGDNGPNTLMGLAGNDTLIGGGGNDILNGGDNIDMAVFDSAWSSNTISVGESAITVANAGKGESDSLVSIERIKFADKSLAFDLDGNAGNVAKLLGIMLGKQSWFITEYVGIGLDILDNTSSTFEQVMGLALDVVLGGQRNNTTVANLLYTNLNGEVPDSIVLGELVSLLESGAMTQESMSVDFANQELNSVNINLVGLAQTGLEYQPLG